MKKKRNNVFDAAAITMILTVAALLLAFFLCSVPAHGSGSAWQVHGNEPVVRLHVRAAGDSEAEQRFKMDLVAQVQRLLAERCLPQGDHTYEAYLDFLGGYLSELESSLQTCAVDAGAEADISVHLGSEYFPIRTYGRRIYPAGEYTALTISIGAGEGENWWCLLFPALCFPPAGVDNCTANHDKEEVSFRTAVKEAPAAKVQGEAAEAETAGGAGRWRVKIWDLIKGPGQQAIEKAGRIFYN